MRNQLVIELPWEAGAEASAELLEAAYRASSIGPVAVVLPLSLRRHADRVLDPVVACVGPTRGGLRYVEATDSGTIRSTLSDSLFAVPASPAFRVECETLGIPNLEAESLISRFRLAEVPATRQPGIAAPLFRSVQPSPAS